MESLYSFLMAERALGGRGAFGRRVILLDLSVTARTITMQCLLVGQGDKGRTRLVFDLRDRRQ